VKPSNKTKSKSPAPKKIKKTESKSTLNIKKKIKGTKSRATSILNKAKKEELKEEQDHTKSRSGIYPRNISLDKKQDPSQEKKKKEALSENDSSMIKERKPSINDHEILSEPENKANFSGLLPHTD
jgi:tRNA pseudouridine-54 N-methylase